MSARRCVLLHEGHCGFAGDTTMFITTRRAVALAVLAGCAAHAQTGAPRLTGLTPNMSGAAATVSTVGAIDRTNPFFQPLGSNGRSCSSCHVQDQGWTITPQGAQARFAATGGTDPLFRT